MKSPQQLRGYSFPFPKMTDGGAFREHSHGFLPRLRQEEQDPGSQTAYGTKVRQLRHLA